MANIIVEASEAWPVVAGSLGAAGIVAAITLWVAHLQRGSDRAGLTTQLDHDRKMRREELVAASDRLDRQLAQDRELREQQQEIDAARLEQQLAHDREMRQQLNDAESKRLNRQLAHDRDMRDLQLMRETLAPLVSKVLDWDAFISLHKGLVTSGGQPDNAWKPVLLPLAKQVADVAEGLRLGGRTLVVIAGPNALVALRMQEVARDGDALIRLVKARVDAGRITPEILQALDDLLEKYGHDHSSFIEAANEAMRWGESESDPSKPSA
jgi:hypothetical protein